MCLVLLMSLMAVTATWNFFLIYLGVGILVYFAYGMWNSKLGRGHRGGGPRRPSQWSCRARKKA